MGACFSVKLARGDSSRAPPLGTGRRRTGAQLAQWLGVPASSPARTRLGVGGRVLPRWLRRGPPHYFGLRKLVADEALERSAGARPRRVLCGELESVGPRRASDQETRGRKRLSKALSNATATAPTARIVTCAHAPERLRVGPVDHNAADPLQSVTFWMSLRHETLTVSRRSRFTRVLPGELRKRLSALTTGSTAGRLVTGAHAPRRRRATLFASRLGESRRCLMLRGSFDCESSSAKRRRSGRRVLAGEVGERCRQRVQSWGRCLFARDAPLLTERPRRGPSARPRERSRLSDTKASPRHGPRPAPRRLSFGPASRC